jgi:predicted nucleic-acid-binding protein
MLAVDTNVVVRVVVNDDAAQARKARAVMDQNKICISTTVLLESAWVLEGAYRFPRAQVVAALRAIAGLPGVTLNDAASMNTALNWANEGMDFADAMHLALTTECDAFVTFDRDLTKLAKRLGASGVREP